MLGELSEHTMSYMDYFEGLAAMTDKLPANRELAETIVIVFRKGSDIDAGVCGKLKSAGFKLAFDNSFFDDGTATDLADIMIIDFPMVSLTVQTNYIKKYKNKVSLLANRIEAWSDYKAARDMGYTLFKGYYFLWPSDNLQQKEIKALDVCLIGIISELDLPEPNFKNISDIIEHDLGLSYKLLRLVNSAYMAPKYRIKSISHALTYLGTRELHQWISMLMFNGIKNEDNPSSSGCLSSGGS
jgi:EAL and modified HD-GYP domain-containing signal transduction protein